MYDWHHNPVGSTMQLVIMALLFVYHWWWLAAALVLTYCLGRYDRRWAAYLHSRFGNPYVGERMKATSPIPINVKALSQTNRQGRTDARGMTNWRGRGNISHDGSPCGH